ncbi:MAG TPA: hypothetical protein VEN81_02110 [Planctomycetota bacterium]|nr:hypothetical protein [Planctomycetota bacterium]
MKRARQSAILLAAVAIAACTRPGGSLVDISGPVGKGYRVLGFGIPGDSQASKEGDLVYLFVFEPESSLFEGNLETATWEEAAHHDASVIRQAISFSAVDGKGKVVHQRSVDLTVNRRDDSFQLDDLQGHAAAGRVVLVGPDITGRLALKRQVNPPGPVRLDLEGVKGLLDGPLGASLGLHR